MASTKTNQSTVPAEKTGMMELRDVSFDRIRDAGMMDLYELSQMAGIQDDPLLTDSEDIRERLILIKRKAEGSSHTWKHLFTSLREETDTKVEALIDLMRTVESTFNTIPTESLSQILRSEGHLHQPNLVEELSIRMNNLKDRKSTVVVAGETNGGKSSFLNLLLGIDILPTNFLHCTFVTTKIVYSEKYSITTLDYDGTEERFPCLSCEEAKAVLSEKVSQQEMKERQFHSPIKEITLGLPADILKSGVTLVDTPGIGEDDQMDNVTMNFVKSTHASAFIYIIKSDTAGGVQEDRLLSFLRAIKERYQSDSLRESFDPGAAMFVCHRWDNIEEDQREKVKKNALERLEYVWPGFDAKQTYFFSTKNTLKHTPVDPEFVTDSFHKLLKGLKQLFDRASHNAIKCQYIWLKYMLQPASNHLRAMITHCIRSNEELEKYFKSVAVKQEKLMASSKENSRKLQIELDSMTRELKSKVSHYLDFDRVSPRMELNEFDELVETCSQDNFLTSRENRRLLDEMILRSLLKYTDEHVSALKLVHEMESKILQAIQDHLGLFKSQIKFIKNDMLHGGSPSGTPNHSLRSLEDGDEPTLGASTGSLGSTNSSSGSIQGLQEDMTLDPAQLARTVKNLLVKRKKGKATSQSLNSRHEFRQSLLGRIKDKVMHGLLKVDPQIYIEERVQKLARDVREDEEIMQSIVSGYAEWIQDCVNYATNSIPKFISVNTKLMDEIREHRGGFQRDKDLLVNVMEDLEPIRHQLRGYGLLYMDDINAESLAFNVDRRASTVFVPQDLISSHRLNDDSGFQGLWSSMKGATIKVDDQAERVVVKTYIYDMDDKVVLSEIASLRCLDDDNIASFFGMTRITSGSTRGNGYSPLDLDMPREKVSAFIFKGDLVSARVFAARRTTMQQQFVPDLILSLLRGLNYIHRERLVHMELNLDTVMVDKVTGEVKLCQMCKPREAIFPAQLEVMTRSCVCLSPSVLQGHIYENTDDMYAFGLLLWELLFPWSPPYKEQRMWPLRRFIDECHPNNMLQEDIKKLDVSQNIQDVLKGTLLVSRGFVCMPIASVESLLSDLREEPIILKLRSRRSQPIMSRQSSLATTPPEIQITSTSGKPQTVTIVTPLEFPPRSPTPMTPPPKRPPRKNDEKKLKTNKKSASTESAEEAKNKMLNLPLQVGARDHRRQSEPIISPKAIELLGLLEPQQKKGSILSRLFKPKKQRRPSADPDLLRKLQHDLGLDSDSTDQSDASASSSRRNSLLSVQTDIKSPRRSSVDVVGPSSYNLLERYAKSDGKDPRRFSLQDQSLHPYKPISVQRKESFDVPKVLCLEKFQSPLGRTLPHSATNSPVQVHRRLPQAKSLTSLHLAEAASKDEFPAQNGKIVNGILKTKSNGSGGFLTHNKLSNSLDQKEFEELSSSDYRRDRMFSVPFDNMKGNPRRPTRLPLPGNMALGSSLQTLSDGSVDHVSHAIEPIIEDSVETASIHEEQSMGLNQSGKEWRTSTKSQWEIGSINNKLMNSSDSGKKFISSQAGTSSSSAYPQSPPVQVTEQFFHSSKGRNSSFDLDLSSSTSSLGPDSGFCTDASGRGVKRPHFFPNSFQDGMPDFSATSNRWDESLNSKNSPHTDSVIAHFRSRSAPLVDKDKTCLATTAHSSQPYSPETVLNNDAITSPSSDVLGNHVLTIISENANLPNMEVASDDAEQDIQRFMLSQQVSVISDSKNNSAPPPPPPINFSELTFRRSSYDDDETTFSFES